MRDDICTIPISEIFEKDDGCPICHMRNMLKERIVDYVLGAAMMEPDIRIQTNKQGFCKDHLKDMMSKRNRLQLGLVLETHLKELDEEVFKKGMLGINAKKSAYKVSKIEQTCFVCEKIEWGMSRLIETLYRTYSAELSFRETFRSREYICLPHYKILAEGAQNNLQKQALKSFNEDIISLSKNHLEKLYSDVNAFTKMFDYRNAQSEEEPSDDVKNAISHAYEYLTGEYGENL